MSLSLQFRLRFVDISILRDMIVFPVVTPPGASRSVPTLENVVRVRKHLQTDLVYKTVIVQQLNAGDCFQRLNFAQEM